MSRHVLNWTAIVCIAVLSSALVFLMPPFQGADEGNHSLKAYTVAHGQLWALQPPGQQPGGFVDAALQRATGRFDGLPFHPDKKVNLAELQAARQIKWSGQQAFVAFPNTAVYFPLFYLPAGLGFVLGHDFGLGVIDSLYLGRAMQAAIYVGLCAAVIFVSRRASGVFIAVLSLPMAISVGSYVTQDGIALAVAALGLAMLHSRLQDGRDVPLGPALGAAMLLMLAALSRPPYVVLLALPVLCTRGRAAAILALVAVVGIVAVGAWSVATATGLSIQWPTDSHVQTAKLLHQPYLFVLALIETFKVFWLLYVNEVVGLLGWLDTYLPPWYIWLAFFMLIVSILLAGEGRVGRVLQPMALAVFAGGLMLAYVALYVIWTPVDSKYVEGVQGRYFLGLLPLLPFAAIGLPKISGAVSTAWQALQCTLLVVTVFVTIFAVATRYYLP